MAKEKNLKEVVQNISLIFEFETAVKLLQKGLGELQRISGANDFYHPLLYCLSNGLERFFKGMLCLGFKEKNGRFPTFKELTNGTNGHDLTWLKEHVEKLCVQIEKTDDLEFILQDEIVNEITTILTSYAKKGRYFELDTVLGNEQPFDPKQEWERLETKILKAEREDYYDLLRKPQNLDMLYALANKKIVAHMEKFLRALSRQFTLGNFSKQAKAFVFQVGPFLDIDDEDLGEIEYNV